MTGLQGKKKQNKTNSPIAGFCEQDIMQMNLMIDAILGLFREREIRKRRSVVFRMNAHHLLNSARQKKSASCMKERTESCSGVLSILRVARVEQGACKTEWLLFIVHFLRQSTTYPCYPSHDFNKISFIPINEVCALF